MTLQKKKRFWEDTLVDRLNWKLDSYKNDLKFDQLPFLNSLRYKWVTYLFRKPKAIPIESKLEIAWILTLMYPNLYITKSGAFLSLKGYIGLMVH